MSRAWHDDNDDADVILQNRNNRWQMLLKKFLLILQTMLKTFYFMESFLFF